jgi:hypothetical protein
MDKELIKDIMLVLYNVTIMGLFGITLSDLIIPSLTAGQRSSLNGISLNGILIGTLLACVYPLSKREK